MMINMKFKILKKLKITNEIKELRRKGAIIGDNVDIIECNMDNTHPHLIKIGNNTTLTHCTIITHDASIKKSLGKSKIGCVFIGENCFIGWGSIVLPNVKIGNNCIIGAGAVVTKNIPDNSVALGNPCKVIGDTNEYINKHKVNLTKKPVFDVDYKKITVTDRKKQFEKLKNGDIGYND